MSEKKPSEQRISAIPPFGLRMLPELRRQIEEAAALNGRSLNAEIVARLEASFAPAVPKPSDKEESDAIALFASGLMQAMHYGKEIGRMVKVEVSVSDDLKPEPGGK